MALSMHGVHSCIPALSFQKPVSRVRQAVGASVVFPYPAQQAQSSTIRLPMGLFEFAGHDMQLCMPAIGLYVSTVHTSQLIPPNVARQTLSVLVPFPSAVQFASHAVHSPFPSLSLYVSTSHPLQCWSASPPRYPAKHLHSRIEEQFQELLECRALDALVQLTLPSLTQHVIS